MKKLNLNAFYSVAINLGKRQAQIEIEADQPHAPVGFGSIMRDADLAQALDYLRELQECLRTLGATHTRKSVHRLLELLASGDATYRRFINSLADIDTRLKDELPDTHSFVVEPNRVELYEPRDPLFGADFETKFPSGIFELDEAAKCFALSRPTAAVFHLMRLMEIGINAVAKSLAISLSSTGSDRNWGSILRKMTNELNRRNTASPKIWADPRNEMIFAQAYLALDNVRQAWRNPTMHVENKYTDEQAEHILYTVRGFMKTLASHFDENGIPLA